MSTDTEQKLDVLAKPQAVVEANVKMGFDSTQGFALMQRAAQLLCQSTLVPKAYQGQGNLPNCVVAMNMANRIGADPLMVMQNLYVVHGNPSWSAQFVIACFNQCGRFSSMRFRWANKPSKPGEIPDNWACQAYATETATGEPIEGPTITIQIAKKEGWYGKSGSKWQTIPELMLMYRAGAWLQRTHAPDISMGLRTAEEEGDIIVSRQDEQGTFVADAQAEAEASVTEKMDDLASSATVTLPPGGHEHDPTIKTPTMTQLIKSIEAAESVMDVAVFLDQARSIKREDWRDKVNDAGRARLAVLNLPRYEDIEDDPREGKGPLKVVSSDGGLFGPE